MGALVVYDPNPWFLHAVCEQRRLRAWKARAAHADRMEEMTELVEHYAAPHKDLLARSRHLRLLIASLTRGVPQTELMDLDEAGLMDTMPEEARRAQQQVLKKAWKLVAQHAHPDKGGSTEAFQFLKECYEAGDIRPLTEYILQLEAPLEQQVAYWTSEYERPHIEWSHFKQMDQYRICQAHMQGNELLASIRAKLMLEQRIRHLEQEYAFLVFHLSPDQMDGNRKERSTDADSDDSGRPQSVPGERTGP